MFKKYNKHTIEALVTELAMNLAIGFGVVTFIIIAFLYV